MPFELSEAEEVDAKSLEEDSLLPAVRRKKVYRVNGPWGELEYYAIHLMAPARYLDILQPDSVATAWWFANTTLDEAGGFLYDLGIRQSALPEDQRSVKYVVEGKDVQIFPSGEMVRSLTPEQRARLAAKLAEDPRNTYHHSPSIIDSGDPKSWFKEAGLSDENAKLIASLCYQRGEVMLFSAMPYVLSLQEGTEERDRILRAATRTRALVVRLNVGKSTHIDEVVDYWTAGHKRKALLPVLESVSEVEEVERIDIAHLLPPIPRMLLYTYPSLASLAQGESRDCHWTSRNFFNPVVTAVGRDPELRSEALMSTLAPVEGAPEFGDTLVVYDAEGGKIIHSMTYVAADIVFTKNGGSVFQPWVLMHYNDALRRYGFDRETTVKVFRRRES